MAATLGAHCDFVTSFPTGLHRERLGRGHNLHVTWSAILMLLLAGRGHCSSSVNQPHREALITSLSHLEQQRGFAFPNLHPIFCE